MIHNQVKMRPESEPLTNGDALHHDDPAVNKDVERETKALSLNVATSTPSIPIHGKIISNGTNGITNSTSTDGGHSPSLLPVSVQWLGQNPNLLGKFLEYYKVLKILINLSYIVNQKNGKMK